MDINEISRKVETSFLRVVKEQRIYSEFIRTFENKRVKFNSSTHNRCKTFRDITNCLIKKAQSNVNEIQNHNNANAILPSKSRKEAYDLIIGLINELIHLFLEPLVQDKRRLGLYGQEMFDFTCNQLFGKDYEDDMMAIGGERNAEIDENFDDNIEYEFVDDDYAEYRDDDDELEVFDSADYYVIG